MCGGELAHGEVVEDQDGGAGQFGEAFVPGLVGVAAGQVGQGAAGLEEPDVGAVADGEVAQGLRDMALPDADRFSGVMWNLSLARWVSSGPTWQFLSDWLARARDHLEASLEGSAGSGAYGTRQLRDDMARFIFLLGGSDGEPLFSTDRQ